MSLDGWPPTQRPIAASAGYTPGRRVAATLWIGRRLATRATPTFLVLLFVLGMPLAFWGTPELIIAIGGGLGILTYAANRHVRADDAMARQWAARTVALPMAGTGWVMLWHLMHRDGLPVLTEPMIIAYWLFGCLAWAWLHTAQIVGMRVGRERLTRDFAAIGKRAGLTGARVVRQDPTRVGLRRLLDIRGTGKTASAIAADKDVAEHLAAAEGLAPGSVRLAASSEHAGYVEVSTYTRNPWAEPIPHPRAPAFAPTGRRSLDEPFPVGVDPETGDEIPFRLADDDGGIHWLVIAGTGGGKSNLLNSVVEHVNVAHLLRHGRVDRSPRRHVRCRLPFFGAGLGAADRRSHPCRTGPLASGVRGRHRVGRKSMRKRGDRVPVNL
mgnify:CR=1 FL=1